MGIGKVTSGRTTGSRLLAADGVINILLGILLVFAPGILEQQLGMPSAAGGFYGSILGGVLFGVGLALLWECIRTPGRPPGVGLAGAILINLAGGGVLISWLLGGRLAIPPHGQALLWFLAVILVSLSLLETLVGIRNQ